MSNDADERHPSVIVFPAHIQAAKIKADAERAATKQPEPEPEKPILRRVVAPKPKPAVKPRAHRQPKAKPAPVSAAEKEASRLFAKGANRFRPGPQKPSRGGDLSNSKPLGRWEFNSPSLEEFAAAAAIWNGKL